jgi:hypothetical protein
VTDEMAQAKAALDAPAEATKPAAAAPRPPLTANTGAVVEAKASPRCARHGVAAIAACAVCRAPVCGACRGRVNQNYVCPGCFATVENELAAERPTAETYARAVAGGLLGALVGAAAWAAISVTTNMELGYVAVGVGLLAGYCVTMFAPGKRGQEIQIIAAACGLVGIALGKYLSIAHPLIANAAQAQGEEAVAGVHYWTPIVARAVMDELPHHVQILDALWIYLVLKYAGRMTAAKSVMLIPPSERAA